MKLFRKRIKGNNRGLSLVELVCAVAIFGVAATAIGSAMVVSAQSYSRGTYELDVQEEAQTATNIVGNLIFDAVGATQNGNVVEIDGEGITYRITHNTTTGTLEYKEIDSAGNESTGVLAENVTSFNTSLTPDPADFDADKNIKVEITIEKNGRTFAASYNTTARNGSANAVGVVEAATIYMDTTVVIEPGQSNLSIPVEVRGSVADKTFNVAKANTSDPYTVSKTANSVTISAGTDAEGVYNFIVTTSATDGTNPLDSKLVTVQVRRVTGIGGTKNFTGTEGAAGSSYSIDFDASCDYPDKVYGKDYDTNYVDPYQFQFSYSIVNPETGYDVDDYITGIVEHTTGDRPYVTFNMVRNLQTGSKIAITCTSKHSIGTNKDGVTYGPVSNTQYIEMPLISMDSNINRGNDGTTEISIDSTRIGQLRLENSGCTLRKIIETYEATIDGSGNIVRYGAPVFSHTSIDTGDNTFIRPIDSKRLVPDKAYVMVVRLEFYNASGTVVWPTVANDPSEYMREFPLAPLSLTYDCHATEGGTSGDFLERTKGTDVTLGIKCTGLDLSRFSNNIKWDIYYKANEGDGWVPNTKSITCSCASTGAMDGTANMNLFFQEAGYYMFKGKLDGYNYLAYDGTTSVTANNVSLNDGSNVGVLYVHVTNP